MNEQPGFQPQPVAPRTTNKAISWIILVVVVIVLFVVGYFVGGIRKNSQVSSLRAQKEKLEQEKEELSNQVEELQEENADLSLGILEISYKNSQYGYQFIYTSDLNLADYSSIEKRENIVAVEKDNKSVFVIKVGRAQRPYDEHRGQAASQSLTISGQSANKYEFPEGVVEEGRKTDPFVAYKIVVGSTQYALEFYGSTSLSETQKRIFNSFKFIKKSSSQYTF